MAVALESVRIMEAGVAVIYAYVSSFLHMLSLYAKQNPWGAKIGKASSYLTIHT